MCQAREIGALASARMMEAFHHEQLAVHGVVSLIQQRAHCWHLRVFEHRTPTRFLVFHPGPHPFAVFLALSGRDMVDKTAQSLPKRDHPQAFALATAVQQGVKLAAQALTHRGRQAHQLVGQLVEGMAQAIAQVMPEG